MDSLTISLELAAIKEQTRRLALWSLIAHAAAVVFFLGAASQQTPALEDDYIITEITWLEPEIEQVELAVAVPEPAPEPAAAAEEVVQETTAPVIPPPEQSIAMVQERLAALRADSEGRRQITTAATASTVDRPTTLGTMMPQNNAPARKLNRTAVQPVTRVAQLPKQRPDVVGTAATALPHSRPDEQASSRQEILQEISPGISLAGEVSGRKLEMYSAPQYPEWAKRDGVEVSVQLFFTVLPNGQVKENVLIERTSGFDDFDRRALAALARWRFEGLAPGQADQQWGRIEFKYRIKDAG